MAVDDSEFECPGENCGHPIKESDLDGRMDFSCPNCSLLYERCFNCQTFNCFGDDDEDESCEECGLSFTKCPTDGCVNQIQSSEIEKNNGFDCPDCGESYGTGDDDDDDDDDDEYTEALDVEVVEDEEEEVEEVEEEEVEEEEEPEPEPIKERKPKKAHKQKQKKRPAKSPKNLDKVIKKTPRTRSGLIRHKRALDDYIDFFLDHPEGVSVNMLEEAFRLDRQAAHYARRKTFKAAESRDYEVEIARVDGTNEKLFFIREN